MNSIKKIRKILSSIKDNKKTEQEIKSLASDFIEVMSETGVPLKIRQEFYYYSQNPTANLGKLIEIAEDTIGIVNEKG